jgi:hypothetical protein
VRRVSGGGVSLLRWSADGARLFAGTVPYLPRDQDPLVRDTYPDPYQNVTDPDPYQNITDPEHWYLRCFTNFYTVDSGGVV